jgi:hypothetical protein
MLSDGIKDQDLDESHKAFDLAELVARQIE